MKRPTLDALTAAIEALVDERVDARLTELGVIATTPEYSSRSLPPRTTGRTFARWCRGGRVPGARRDGSGWMCSIEGWRSARAAGARLTTTTAAPANDGPVDLDAMLSGAGLRATARGRR